MKLKTNIGSEFWNFDSPTHRNPTYAIQQPIKFGKYSLGEVNFSVGRTGLSFSWEAKADDFARVDVKRTLESLTKEYAPEVLSGLDQALKPLGVDFSKIIVKELALEGPGGGVQANIGLGGVSAGISKQLLAMRLVLETPVGEVEARLRGGMSYSNTLTQKVGVSQGKHSVSFGLWEVGVTPGPVTEDEPMGDPLSAKESAVREQLNEAKKKAQAFIRKQEPKKKKPKKGAAAAVPAPAVEKSVETLEEEVMQESAEQMKDAFAGDDTVKDLYEEYMGAATGPGAKEAYQTYMSSVGKHASEVNKMDEYIQAGFAASYFCGQLAQLTGNRTIAKVGVGIGALTQAVSGTAQVVSVLSTGVATMTAGAQVLGGVGLVIGAGITIASLFAEPEPDPVMDALEAINQNILGMWSDLRDMWADQRASFEATWDMMAVMERNNWERFEHTLSAISFIQNDMALRTNRLERVIGGRLSALHLMLQGSIRYLMDADMRKALLAIEETSADKLAKKCVKFSPTLYQWLTEAVRTDACTARVLKDDADGRLKIEPALLRDQLKESLRLSADKIDIPLGLYVSVASMYDKSLFEKLYQARLPNPRGWLEICTAYCGLLVTAKAEIAKEEKIDVYMQRLKELKRLTQQVQQFYQAVATSEALWRALLKNFVDVFNVLLNKIDEKEKELNTGPGKPATYNLVSLSRTARENVAALIARPEADLIVRAITKSITWAGAETEAVYRAPLERDTDTDKRIPLFPSIIHHPSEHVPPGLKMVFSPEMMRQCKVYDCIKSDAVLALGILYGESIRLRPKVIFCPQRIGNNNVSGDFLVTCVLAFRIEDSDYTLYARNLYNRRVDPRSPTFGSIQDYVLDHSMFIPEIHHDWPTIRFYWEHRDYRFLPWEEFQDNFLTKGHEAIFSAFEKNLLIPARKEVVKEYCHESKLQDYIEKLELAYWQFCTFLSCVDPSVTINPRPEFVTSIKSKIQALLLSGSVSDFISLKTELLDLKENLWKILLREMGYRLWEDMEVVDLLSIFAETYQQSPIWFRMHAAQAMMDRVYAELARLKPHKPVAKEESDESESDEGEMELSRVIKLCEKLKLPAEKKIPTVDTALARAVRKADLKDIYVLIKHASDINAQDTTPDKRKTAMHWAVLANRCDVVVTLLESGASRNIKDAAGKTPVDYALESENDEMKSLFKTYDARFAALAPYIPAFFRAQSSAAGAGAGAGAGSTIAEEDLLDPENFHSLTGARK